jgi:hypothetical protein
VTPETTEPIASSLALAGWIALALGPLAPRAAQAVAGLAVPLVLALIYTGVMLVHFPTAEGGFGSLAEIAALFDDPWLLLAGWVHFLAFDLLIGAWIARKAAREGMAHWLVLPCLFLTLMAGPAGWLALQSLRPLTRKVAA